MDSLDGNDTECVQISDLHPDTFLFLHKLFYQSFDIRIDRQNVIQIMNAANTYNILHLEDCCFKYISSIDFHVYSSSFFFLLHEIEKYSTPEKAYFFIIHCLQPIANISQFTRFFNHENKTSFRMLRQDTILHLLFSARKFENIQQEYIWQICLIWAQYNLNDNDAVWDKMQCYVQYFDFGGMDWSFFIEHVYNT
eukprot:979229_1